MMMRITALLLVLLASTTRGALVSQGLPSQVVQGIPEGWVPHGYCRLTSSERVLFVVNDEPWALAYNMNGTLEASVLHQFDPGATEIFDFYPLKEGREAVFLAREARVFPLELWKTDGSPDGTRKLHTFDPNRVQEPPTFTLYKEELYFAQGSELWKMDDSYDPVLVHDLNEDSNRRDSIYTMYVWQDILYISLGGESGLFRTDGTPKGLQMIHPAVSVKFRPYQPVLRGRLYFITTQRELWSTDGTKHRTGPVAASTLQYTDIVDLFQYPVHNRIVFGMGDARKPHLFATDGTDQGTLPLQVQQLEDAFVFEQQDTSDILLPPATPQDNTNDVIVDFREDYGEVFYFPGRVASTQVMPTVDDNLAFTVDGQGTFSLWTTDGKSAQLVHEFVDREHYDSLDLGDGRFLIRTVQPDEIWMSDGSFSGTTKLYQASPITTTTTSSNSNTTTISTGPSVYDLQQSWTGTYWALLSDTELVFTGYDYTKSDDETDAIPPQMIKVNIPSLNDVGVAVTRQQDASGAVSSSIFPVGSVMLMWLLLVSG